MHEDDWRLKAWHDLCPPCTAAFRAWQCAPNPSPLLSPRVQQYPQLMAFLASCRAGGPSPEAWRETISAQLLLIRRICTDNKDGTHGDYTPVRPPDRIIWPAEKGELWRTRLCANCKRRTSAVRSR